MELSHKWQTKGIMEGPAEECGVIGIYSPECDADIASLSYLALYALQHRGQQSAGICVSGEDGFESQRGLGLVTDVFEKEDLAEMSGNLALGHVRYSTTGSDKMVNAQPLLTSSIKGDLALALNGNIINHSELRSNLEERGAIFHSDLDTEVIAHLTAHSFSDDPVEALVESLHKLKGAFSLVAMTENRLVAARDPRGFRPLVLGKREDTYIVASETCAFDILEAEKLREIEPGELIVVDESGIQSRYYREHCQSSFCSFEFIYFARPDSIIGGQNVRLARKKMGWNLSKEAGIDGDIVVPVPSSGISAGLGFSEESGLPYKQGILQNKYIGRSFVMPTENIRDLQVRAKLNPISSIINDSRIILIDDSIVRGTTSRQIIKMLRSAGAREVHMGVSSPALAYPCYYGMDTSRRQQLIAAEKSREEIREHIGADSLTYLSREGLLAAINAEDRDYCTACFDGEYPLAR